MKRTMVVVVKDKGFGEFYPSTGASIVKVLQVERSRIGLTLAIRN